jgi:hypothetical protein
MDRIPVECIVEMKSDHIKPIRIRYEDREGKHVVTVDSIISQDKKKIFATMNNPVAIDFIFKCETIIHNMKKPFTLVFNNQSCKWYLLRQ